MEHDVLVSELHHAGARKVADRTGRTGVLEPPVQIYDQGAARPVGPYPAAQATVERDRVDDPAQVIEIEPIRAGVYAFGGPLVAGPHSKAQCAAQPSAVNRGEVEIGRAHSHDIPTSAGNMETAFAAHTNPQPG